MSLITDALKKAQASRLARRYVTTKPPAVLPVVGAANRGGVGAGFAAILKGNNFPKTLGIGLASGIVLFLVLFVYFFYGPGQGVRSSLSRASLAAERSSQSLVLTPPPSVPDLEPLKFEGESLVAQKSPGGQPTVGRLGLSPDNQGERVPHRRLEEDTVVKRVRTSKVSVTSDLSEEVRTRFNLALFYHEGKKFAQAKQEYEKVIQMWPLYAEAHNNLGLVYKELGMHGKAIWYFKKALALNPGYVRAYHNLGVIFHLRGDLKQAKKNYLAALALDRNNLSSLNNLGLVYRGENQFYDARKVLEKALLLKPKSPQTQYNLALVLEELGELTRARSHYQEFVNLTGQENQALAQRVKVHLQELALQR